MNDTGLSVNFSKGNFSDLDLSVAEWSAFAISTLIIFLLVLSTNGVTLCMFIKDNRLRTPFGVFLMFLLAANILFALLQNPLEIINNLYPKWWLGSGWCSVYIYATYITAACSIHSHVFITCNRIWAIVFPISYKHANSTKLAVLSCSCLWLYVHVVLLPGYIQDAMLYRLPLETNGCSLNATAQETWSIATQFIIYLLPEVVILSTYPFLWYKRSQRLKLRNHRVSPNSQLRLREKEPVEPASTAVNTTNSRTRKRESKESSSRAFIALTLLTASVLICWTPNNVFFTVAAFLPLDYPVVLRVTTILQTFQSVLDPVFFVIALKDLRVALSETFRTAKHQKHL